MSKQNQMPENGVITRHTDNLSEGNPKVLMPGHWVILVICVLSAVLSMSMGIMRQKEQDAKLQAQFDEIARLDSQITVQEAANAEKEISTVMDITGLDRHKVEMDDARAERFFSKVLTWEDYDTYMNNREELMYEYELSPDSNFMSVFYPAIHRQQRDDGTYYNKIDDEGINMRYESIKSHVCSISGDSYSYIAEVTYSSLQEKWNYRGTGKTVVLYTFDKDGNLSGLDAYALFN